MSNLIKKDIPELAVQRNFIETRADAQIKAQRPPLTAEERARPYAKYYDEPIAAPDPGHRTLMDSPIDPAKAIFPEEIGHLLDLKGLKSGDEAEVGWCSLPNGAGYIANTIFYPNATAEMIEWWFTWHALEDLRYRLWFPPQHGGIHLSPRDRARVLDESIPLKERNIGVTHYVIEDTNTGMSHIDITWRTAEQMSFDSKAFDKVIAASSMGIGWQRAVVETPHTITAPAIMCHLFYAEDGGLRQRTRFWQGYRFNALGKPELNLPSGERVPETEIKGLAQHNVDEFSRLRVILPKLYAEFGHSMVC
ncbi:DAPG hydrolase family protein [Halotalea alkalilenta]|uniref:DAPG hydrolase family protein n=1 Tax=Halotalea alkalilenta TaxID=376489 RepID=UPI0006950BD9|nr:hypothetical protein [Halotalea alkalilenta]